MSPAGPIIRFIHTADWQLGMTRHYLPPEAQARFAQARFDAIHTLGRRAREHGASFVLVCGDVFETNRVERRTVARALEAMARAEIPFYLLPGNHDPIGTGSVYLGAEFSRGKPDNVHVLADATPRPVGPGVELVGAPWRTKRPGRDAAAEVVSATPPPGISLRIGAAHGAVSALSPDRHDPALISVERAEEAIAANRLHYLALGDRHSLTAVGTTGRIFYSGAPEPTDFDEQDPGKALVVELAPGHVDARPIDVGTWTMERRSVTLRSADDVAALLCELDALPGKERCVVELALAGALSLAESGALEAGLERMGELFAAIEIPAHKRTLTADPHPDDLETVELAGFARSALARLDGRARGGGPDAATARDAIALLLEIARRADA